MDFRHYRMENRPTLMNGSEAWWVVDGEWRMLDTSEAFMNAVFIGESVFGRRFKFLPPLPVGAFSARIRLHRLSPAADCRHTTVDPTSPGRNFRRMQFEREVGPI